jgi:acyl-CoA dehydrogenase
VDKDLLDQIFDFMVRDFSKYALQLYSKPSSTEKQMELCMKMIRKPAVDEARYERVLKNHVYALKDVYEMNP